MTRTRTMRHRRDWAAAIAALLVVCTSGSAHADEEAFEAARGVVSGAHQASGEVSWEGWLVGQDVGQGVRMSRGEWVMTSRSARLQGEVIELRGDVVISGQAYTLSAQQVTVSPLSCGASDARLVWHEGAVLEVKHVELDVIRGEAILTRIEARGGTGRQTGSEKTER